MLLLPSHLLGHACVSLDSCTAPGNFLPITCSRGEVRCIVQDGASSAPLTKQHSRNDFQTHLPNGMPGSPRKTRDFDRRQSIGMGMLQRLKSSMTPRKAPSNAPSRQPSHDSVESEASLGHACMLTMVWFVRMHACMHAFCGSSHQLQSCALPLWPAIDQGAACTSH